MLNDKGEEVGIIYGWYCTVTDKWYIGQTIRPEARFKRHIDYAINKKDNNKFHNALRKYGLYNFVYCVLEENVLIDNLDMREIYWIEEFDSFYSGYNLTLGGDGSKGFIMPEEQKKRRFHNLIKVKHRGTKANMAYFLKKVEKEYQINLKANLCLKNIKRKYQKLTKEKHFPSNQERKCPNLVKVIFLII